MKYTHFGIVVISLTVAGVAFPVRAASLPTYKAPTSSVNPASVAVEDSPNELNAAPWSTASQPQVERSIAGDLAGDMLVTQAPWKSVLADGTLNVDQRSLVDALSVAGSPANLTGATANGLPEIGRQASATGWPAQAGGLGGGLARGSADQAIGTIDYRMASPAGDSTVAWTAMLMLMPMVGGVFIACGGRRKHPAAAPEGVYLHNTPNIPRPVPAPLAALGLSAECSEDDIKRAFRQRAMTAHPDRGGDARDFMTLQRNFEASLRIVRGAAMRANSRPQSGSRQAA